MDLNIVTGLRLVHISAGIFWAGSALILAGFIEPAVKMAGSEGVKFMQALMQKTRFSLIMNLSAALNTLTGVLLFWWASGGFQLSWLISIHGLSFTIGAAAGVLALVVGVAVSAPTAKRVAIVSSELAVDGPGAAVYLGELNALEQRLQRAGQLGALLLVVSVIGMSLARYI